MKKDPGFNSLVNHSDLSVDLVCTYGVLVYCGFDFLFGLVCRIRGPLRGGFYYYLNYSIQTARGRENMRSSIHSFFFMEEP